MKKTLSLFLAIILTLSMVSGVYASEASDLNVAELQEAITEHNESFIDSLEKKKNEIVDTLNQFPEDEVLQEVKQYLDEKPELSDGQIISDFSVNVLLYDDGGSTLSLDNYIEELEEQASFKTSLRDEEIKPLASGGIVWVNSINGNLNTRNIEITTKYVSYVGSKPDSVSFTNKFLASDVQTNNKAYYAEKGRESKYLTRNQSFTSTLRAQTKYWIGSTEVKVFEKGLPVGIQTGDTNRVLYNNAALPYHKYVDPHSGLVNHEPSSTTWQKVANPTPWDSSKDRGEYITYYINTYGNPGWNWASYDIHHIKPREYGGGNEKSNLIPVPRSIHQQLITAWWNSYNKG